jgi:hypothetical protein
MILTQKPYNTSIKKIPSTFLKKYFPITIYRYPQNSPSLPYIPNPIFHYFNINIDHSIIIFNCIHPINLIAYILFLISIIIISGILLYKFPILKLIYLLKTHKLSIKNTKDALIKSQSIFYISDIYLLNKIKHT